MIFIDYLRYDLVVGGFWVGLPFKSAEDVCSDASPSFYTAPVVMLENCGSGPKYAQIYSRHSSILDMDQTNGAVGWIPVLIVCTWMVLTAELESPPPRGADISHFTFWILKMITHQVHFKDRNLWMSKKLQYRLIVSIIVKMRVLFKVSFMYTGYVISLFYYRIIILDTINGCRVCPGCGTTD